MSYQLSQLSYEWQQLRRQFYEKYLKIRQLITRKRFGIYLIAIAILGAFFYATNNFSVWTGEGDIQLQTVYDLPFGSLATDNGQWTGWTYATWKWRVTTEEIQPTQIELRYTYDLTVGYAILILSADANTVLIADNTYELAIYLDATDHPEESEWYPYFELGTTAYFGIGGIAGDQQEYYQVEITETNEADFIIISSDLTYYSSDPFGSRYAKLTGPIWDILAFLRGNPVESGGILGVNTPKNLWGWPTELIYDVTIVIPGAVDWILDNPLGNAPKIPLLATKIIIDAVIPVFTLGLLFFFILALFSSVTLITTIVKTFTIILQVLLFFLRARGPLGWILTALLVVAVIYVLSTGVFV